MRKICVFTGTRAEYGLLKSLMGKIQTDPALHLQIIASGTHLSHEFGMSHRQIKADGFVIDEKIDILLNSKSSTGICRSMGLGLDGYGTALERLCPDLLVVLGDRFETFAAVTSAQVCNVPVAHIHGGEVTVGAMDDAFRHSITKMAHLHFTCCDAYRKRVIQLGENPQTVFNVGGLGVENIRAIGLMQENEIRKYLEISDEDPFLLVTFHPVTRDIRPVREQVSQLFHALMNDRFDHFKIVFTGANADTGGQEINQAVKAFLPKKKKQFRFFTNLGQMRYLSAMKFAKVVVGNSSSGLLEAPAFKVPVVNVGRRQQGRICARNVISCPCREKEIVSAIETALSENFIFSIRDMIHPFEKEGTATAIKEIIKSVDLANIQFKEFYDYE